MRHDDGITGELDTKKDADVDVDPFIACRADV